jgi:hypothetical protein
MIQFINVQVFVFGLSSPLNNIGRGSLFFFFQEHDVMRQHRTILYAVDCNCMSLKERNMQNAYLCNGTAFQRIVRIMEIVNIRKMMHILYIDNAWPGRI